MKAALATIHPDVRAYHDEFQQGNWAKRGPGFVREARRESMRMLAEKGWPDPASDLWRHSPTRALTATHFAVSAKPARVVTEAEVAPYRIAETHELVFIDGHHAPAFDRSFPLPHGSVVQPLSQSLARPTDTLEMHLARHAGDDGLVALNTAFFEDGGFVQVAPNTQLSAPVHLLHLATEPHAPTASHLRHLIVAESGSECTVIESYVGLPSGDAGLTTAVTELVAAAGSHVHHVKLQRENIHAHHYGTLSIRQDRDAVVDDHLLSVGAAMARNHAEVVLGSSGSEVHLNGLFLATGQQRVDNPTRIDHAVAHTTSRELYKGVIDGAAHGAFLGMVQVRADAQKTDSGQQNRNLLLSPQATVDTTPQLEIHADDVKCSHGSTIGALSKDSLFFLRSRGLGPEEARLMLTKAFAHEVIGQAPQSVRPLMDQLLTQWFACRSVSGKVAP